MWIIPFSLLTLFICNKYLSEYTDSVLSVIYELTLRYTNDHVRESWRKSIAAMKS